MPNAHNDNAREHIVINEGADERDIPTREAFDPPAPARMVGPDRGAYEAWAHRFAAEFGRYPCVLVEVPVAGRRRVA